VCDTVLMALMVVDIWVLTVIYELGILKGGSSSTQYFQLARLVRLARMARMAKVMRALPELMVLIKGMRVACRSVFFTLVLLMIIIYAFAIFFVELAKGTPLERHYFGSMPSAMGKLLVAGAMPDLFDQMDDMYAVHGVFALVFLIFILLSSLTVMNMLVGVLCETVSVVSAVEKEQMDAGFIHGTLTTLLRSNGVEDTSCIRKVDFVRLLDEPEAARALQGIGVDVVGLVDYTYMLFDGAEAISFTEFMELLLQLRGGNRATVKDIVEMRKFLCDELLGLEVRLAGGSRGPIRRKEAANTRNESILMGELTEIERMTSNRRTWRMSMGGRSHTFGVGA